MSSDAFPPSHLCWDAAGSAEANGIGSKLLSGWLCELCDVSLQNPLIWWECQEDTVCFSSWALLLSLGFQKLRSVSK